MRASLAAKPSPPQTAGSLRADSATFGFTLWAVIVISGLLIVSAGRGARTDAEHLAPRT
jgi:K+-transporting ATPase A subunit